MATANLIQVGTPGPALANGAETGDTTLPTSTYNTQFTGGSLSLVTQNTFYQVNSISLTAGTWLVIGLCNPTGAVVNTFTLALSLTTASGTNAAPMQGGSQTSATASPPLMVSSVIKVTSTTTIYLNAACTTNPTTGFQGGLYAVKIA